MISIADCQLLYFVLRTFYQYPSPSSSFILSPLLHPFQGLFIKLCFYSGTDPVTRPLLRFGPSARIPEFQTSSSALSLSLSLSLPLFYSSTPSSTSLLFFSSLLYYPSIGLPHRILFILPLAMTGPPHAGPEPFHSPPSAAPSHPPIAFSPPSRRDLVSWWRQFRRNARREEAKGASSMPVLHPPDPLAAVVAGSPVRRFGGEGETETASSQCDK